MSDIYGYQRGVQYNNDIMSRNTRLQQSIADSNAQTIDDYKIKNQLNTKVSKGIESTAEKAESAKEEQKGEEGAGEFLADARNVYKVGGAVRKEISNVNNAVKSFRRANFINEGGGIDPTGDATGRMVGQTPARELDLGSDLTDVADDAVRGGTAVSRGADLSGVLRYGGEALQNTLMGGARGAGEAFTGTRSALQGAVDTGTQALQDTAEATRLGDTAGMVEGVGNVVSSAKSGLSALDSIGKTAEGLNVVSGVSDVLDDMDGGFKKMNTAEKVGNVAGITGAVASAGSLAGSLESAGAMLDATGIGAEIGLGLNIAGAVAGGVSALSDYIGGKEKQKRQTPAPTQLQAPQLQPQAQAPISALQSGGVALSSY
jgi:hypothetical protein